MQKDNKYRIIFYSFLFILFLVALWSKNNADKIYAFAAQNAYKHNDIEKAQTYFEKSFALGNKNTTQREAYVNSIINSPLTINSQKKLVSIAENDFQDSASAKAQYFLYDLKREIHNTHPLNYIKQAPFNQKIVHWGSLPVTYAFKNTNTVSADFVNEIKNAFSEWERYTSIMFAETGLDEANIIIDFRQNKIKDIEYGKKYVVAYTTPIINQNYLKNMYIIFFATDPTGKLDTNNQIYNTALHEIFHALGFMGHSYNKDNIMYLSKDNNTLINDTREELTQADITTLNLLYQIQPDITNKQNMQWKYLPYLVLGDDDEVNFSKSREAKNYIRHAPTLPVGYIDLAETYVADKRYPEAIKCLEKALTLSESKDMDYIIFYNLAVSYFYINHLEMSLEYLNKAMEIKNTEELHFLLAEIYMSGNKEQKAIEEYNYLIKIAPNNVNYVINLANIYIKKYNYLKARFVIKNFLKNNPQEKHNSRLAPYGILKL